MTAARRMRPALGLALAAVLGGCADLPLPPSLEAGGEPGAPIYTAAGTFSRIGYDVVGRATYTLDENGQAALALSADFSAPEVPKTSVFLSNTADLSQAVKVAELRVTEGAQRWTFRVPRGAVWTYALLWSEDLRVGVGKARLDPK